MIQLNKITNAYVGVSKMTLHGMHGLYGTIIKGNSMVVIIEHENHYCSVITMDNELLFGSVSKRYVNEYVSVGHEINVKFLTLIGLNHWAR